MIQKTLISVVMIGLFFISIPHAKTYESLKANSRITYYLKHPLHLVEGFTKDFVCQVDFNGDTLASTIKVKVPVLTFNSGNSNRDSHALETLEAFKYPFVEFSSDSVRNEGPDFRVFGKLLFHGISKPINFVVKYRIENGLIRILARFSVKLSDFKIKRPSLMFLSVEDELKIQIDASAKQP